MKVAGLLLLLMLAPVAGVESVAAASPGLALHQSPKELPSVRFHDGEGRPRSLADFHGRVVLLNIWATWCVPCRKEMPTLDRLQAALGGASFEVVALSIDRGGLEVVGKFYREVGISYLATDVDNTGKAARELAAVGLPTTLLIDRAGREIGRLVGPSEWDAPDMMAFIQRQLK